jgi:hypothetical protein
MSCCRATSRSPSRTDALVMVSATRRSAPPLDGSGKRYPAPQRRSIPLRADCANLCRCGPFRRPYGAVRVRGGCPSRRVRLAQRGAPHGASRTIEATATIWGKCCSAWGRCGLSSSYCTKWHSDRWPAVRPADERHLERPRCSSRGRFRLWAAPAPVHAISASAATRQPVPTAGGPRCGRWSAALARHAWKVLS